MEISSLNNSPKVMVELAKSRGIEQLAPGSRLQATVVEKGPGNQLLLNIGSRQLRFESPLSLRSGDKLLMELVRQGPMPRFELVRPSTAQSVTTQEVQTRLLRQLVPKLQQLEPLLQQARLFLRSPSGLSAEMPPKQLLENLARQAVQQALGASLPRTNTPMGSLEHPRGNSPEPSLTNSRAGELIKVLGSLGESTTPNRLPDSHSLKQLFSQSGLLLEAQLARGQLPAAQDIKLLLLKLLSLLGHEPVQPLQANPGAPPSQPATANPALDNPLGRFLADLLQLGDGALARLQLQQLAAVPQEGSNRQVWQLGIPLPDLQPESSSAGLAHMRIERESVRREQKETESWSLNLVMNIQPLGPMEVRIKLLEQEVNAHFITEMDNARERIEALLPRFQSALESIGLKVLGLSASRGVVAQDNPRDTHPGLQTERLLDEQA